MGRKLVWWSLVVPTIAGVVSAPLAPLAAAPVFDAVLGIVDGKTVAASDIALARALGVLGFAPSSAPITRDDVERFADIRLMLDEAGRVGITAEPEQIERVWAAVTARAGGKEPLQRWLATHAIDATWAHRLVEQDVVRTRFVDERFVAFVFVDEEQIARELGPGQHDESARETVRIRLTRDAAGRAQAEWLDAARRRATIQLVVSDGAPVPLPFPPP
jgi:hypothetical protein